MEASLPAVQAVNYLKAIDRQVGSSNASFYEAFTFTRASGSSSAQGLVHHRKSSKRKFQVEGAVLPPSTSNIDTDEPSSPSNSDDDLPVNTTLAKSGSLYNAAEGFWPTVGWAFNTSIRHPQRWSYWKQWISLMLSFLDKETSGNITPVPPQANTETNPILIVSSSPDEPSSPTEGPSLSSLYLSEVDLTSRASMRKISRAVFADGSQQSLSEFHEIWPGETLPPKTSELSKRSGDRKKLDLDEGEFGDYWDDEADDEVIHVAMKQETGRQRTSGRTIRQRGKYHVNMNLDHGLEAKEVDEADHGNHDDYNPTKRIGGIDSLILRRQVLAWVANAIPSIKAGTRALGEFVDLIGEFVKPLPLPVFTFIISPQPAAVSPCFSDVVLARLHMSILHTLLASTYTALFQDVLPNQEVLQAWYLRLSTTSSNVTDLAKLYLLLEALTRILWKKDMLRPDAGLAGAVEEGNSVRKSKLDSMVKKGQREGNSEAIAALKSAMQRLDMIVGLVERS